MPQGVSENSLATNIYPLLPGNSQVVVQDDLGVANPIDVTDVAVIPHRELVNLENAAVNIDNSSDVIIGPVTQFNVNGNVIIRQHENGGRLGLGLDQDEEKDGGSGKDTAGAVLKLKPNIPRIFLTLLDYIKQEKTRIAFIAVFVVITIASISAYLIVSSHPEGCSEKDCKKGDHDRWEVDRVGNYSIYSKNQWRGDEPKSVRPLPLPIGLVIISHSVTSACDNFDSCSQIVRSIQKDHFDTGLSDVCYNFLVGGDGSIFVGRGWETRNCHSKLSIGINFIGDFTKMMLNASTIESTRMLLDKGVELVKIAEDYILIGHNQTMQTLSPGMYAYEVIKRFSHFDDIDLRRS